MQDVAQVGFVPGEGIAVKEFVAAGLYPAFRDRVLAWHPDARENGSDAGVGEDLVDDGGVLRVAVADDELGPLLVLQPVVHVT
ncbi:hypothetical protein ABZT51_51650 [Streptomyces sp. NPDC005373]|uniref:hypothetical protein n=1 Tax=Streptomyces sp. NPDC005373 TaxID=3156879 RepID=UPI0033AA4331